MEEKKSLFRSTSLVTVNRIISSILGFMRDMVWARIFGASVSFDAFVIAFHLPSFISYMISEAGLTRAFIPVLCENQIRKNSSDVKKFISHVSALLLVGLIFIVIFSIIFSPEIIKLFAPGFTASGNRQQLTVSLFRIMATGIFFSTLASLCSAILNAYGNYSVSSFTQIIFNISIIIISLFFTSFFNVPVYAVAWGILFSGILQLSLQIPFLHKKKLLVMPRLVLKDHDLRKTVKLMIPALLGVSVMQAGVLVDFIFSSTLPVGSITWLYYSAKLMELPVNTIGMGIATVVLPNLGRSHATNDHVGYNNSLNWAIHLAFFTSIPASIGLFLLAGPIVATLFGHGLFNQHDVMMTEKSTQAFAIGIVGFMVAKICASGFYAKQNTKLPMKIAVITVLLNIMLNFLLISKLAHVGLALATSLSNLVNAVVLLTLLIKKKHFQAHTHSTRNIFKILFSAAMMLLVLSFITPHFHIWLNEKLKWQIEHLFFDMTIAIVVYFAILFCLGFKIASLRGDTKNLQNYTLP